MKHLFLSMSVKQNLSVSVFVHKCLMVLNDVENATFKMFVTQISNYLFVISFQLMMFYKTLRFSLARPYVSPCIMCVQYIGGCSVHRGVFSTSGDTMSTSGDTMSTSGDIMSTSGDVQYIGGIS